MRLPPHATSPAIRLVAGRRPDPPAIAVGRDLDRRVAELPESGAVAPVQAAPTSVSLVGGQQVLALTSVDPAQFPPLRDGATDGGSLGAIV